MGSAANQAGIPEGIDAELLSRAPAAMAVLDAALRYRWVNETMARLNGRPAADHVGRHVRDVLHDTADDVIPLMQGVLDSGQALSDIDVQTGPVPGLPTQRICWRASYLPTVLADDDDPRGLVVFAEDVTGRRATEAARAQGELRTERFAALAAAVAAAISIEDVADVVHDMAGTALGASSCGIALRTDTDGIIFAGQAAASGTGRWSPVQASDDTPLAHVVRTGQPLFLHRPEDLTGRWPHLSGLQHHTGDQAWAALPLTNTREVIGVLAFAFSHQRTLTTEDQQYLASIAGLTSQALQRAYAHRRDHSIAQTLQQALLPAALPQIPGLQAACRYRAADNSADIGGDFYDLFSTDDGVITAVIGDVCQGGLIAAAMVGQARYSLRALVTAQQPNEALRSLNALLLRDNPDRRFLTAACLQLHPGPQPTVTIANGGHLPPLAVAPDHTVRPLGSFGTLLGVFDDVHLTQRTEALQPGSAIVLYTDGITEARGAEGFYGEQRLTELLRTAPDLSAEKLADYILNDVTAFETRAPDDIAVLVLTLDETDSGHQQ